jgi:Na+-driven multidrug efflux pump
MGNILWWIMIIAVWGAIMAFHNQLIEWFGDIERAERNNIGTKAMYILMAMFIIVIGVFILFGMGPKDPTATNGMWFETKKTK